MRYGAFWATLSFSRKKSFKSGQCFGPGNATKRLENFQIDLVKIFSGKTKSGVRGFHLFLARWETHAMSWTIIFYIQRKVGGWQLMITKTWAVKHNITFSAQLLMLFWKIGAADVYPPSAAIEIRKAILLKPLKVRDAVASKHKQSWSFEKISSDLYFTWYLPIASYSTFMLATK